MEKNKQIAKLLKDLPQIPKVNDGDTWHIEHHNTIAKVLNHIIAHIGSTDATDITIHEYLQRLSKMILSYHNTIKSIEKSVESLVQKETSIHHIKQKCTATSKENTEVWVNVDLTYDKDYVIIIEDISISENDDGFRAIIPKLQKIKKWEHIKFDIFSQNDEQSSWVVKFKVLAITI